MPSMNTSRRRQASSTCVYSSAMKMKKKKKKITKSKSSEDDIIRKVAPTAVVQQQYTTTTTKRNRDDDSIITACNKNKLDDDSRTIQPPPIAAAETTIRKQLVQVERLGGLKLRFRFSRGDIAPKLNSSSKSSGDHSPLPVPVVKTKKLAVQEIISSTTNDDDERNRCTVRSWRQMKLQREREASRRKIESMIKTVDISNNYYDTMTQLDRMFGDSEWVMEAFYGARNQKPLQKLGLFLKGLQVQIRINQPLSSFGSN